LFYRLRFLGGKQTRNDSTLKGTFFLFSKTSLSSKLIGYGQDGKDFAICVGFGFNFGFTTESNV
jgi:hypothetical protein